MEKMNKKGLAFLAWIAVAVVGLVSAVFVTPLGEILSIGDIEFCSETPFDDRCVCLDDEEKFTVDRAVDRYFCEKENGFFEPRSEGFESQAVSHMESSLQVQYPDCDMNTCQRESTEWVVEWGYEDYEKRSVSVECKEKSNSAGFTFASGTFDTATGATQDLACANYGDVVEETSTGMPASLELGTGMLDNRVTTLYTLNKYNFVAKCGDVDNGVGFATLTVPSEVSVARWYVGTGSMGFDENDSVFTPRFTPWAGLENLCVELEHTPNSFSFKCDSGCPNNDIKIGVTVIGMLD